MPLIDCRLEKSGIQQPAHTVLGRLEQARRWLEQPALEDRGVGQQVRFYSFYHKNCYQALRNRYPTGWRSEI